jgi:hypothetical protein
MKHGACTFSHSGVLTAMAAAGALFALGCEGELQGPPGAAPIAGTSGTSGTGGTTSTGGTGASGAGGTGASVGCEGSYLRVPKRLVRLSTTQLVNAYADLFTQPGAATILAMEDIAPATNRPFPPLASGGTSIGATQWSFADRLGQEALKYIGLNFASLTQCGPAPTDPACAQQAVLAFAQRAYRRPLTPEETTVIATNLWNDMALSGATVPETIQYGMYYVLSAPQFLYRTEFGDNPAAEGPLTPYEIASELAFFVTDAPPDADLLTAAAAKSATVPAQRFTQDEIRTHITRLLGSPAARANLEAAMIAYFQLPGVPAVVIDPPSVPGISVTEGLKLSMYHEGELFVRNTLWAGPLSALVTSRRTWVNDQIAMPIYGVATPTVLDAEGFGPVDLMADRAGLLTLSPFLMSKARPDGTSVVGRGLAVNAALLCQDNPVLPEPLPPDIEQGIADSMGLSSKEAAERRKMNSVCAGCHAQFDGFGLVLEPYDSIGRLRTMDLMGNPIDASVTTTILPEAAGSVTVTNAAETSQAILASGALNACMAMNFINFALADVTQGGAGAPSPQPPPSSCAVKDVVDRFNATDLSFTSLIREIAASETLALRKAGM